MHERNLPQTQPAEHLPPKKGAKNKAPKLSKAEKEKLKKEESEQKAKEEEEARIQAEQEQREKEEREKLEREEKERLAQQEIEQHQAEVDELDGALENKYNHIKNDDQVSREKAKWERYMLCDGSPNPKITKEINTYINLWKEDVTAKPVHKIIQECHDALKLIDELQFYVSEEPELAEQEIAKHKETITQLENLMGGKLDEATMHILKSPDDYIDSDTQNIQFEMSSRSIALNIWGNISRNPRIKSVTFDKKGLVIEIPKALSLGNVAVRCIFTNYDHLSEKSRLFYPRPKKVPDVVVQKPAVEEISVEIIDEDKKEGENDDNVLNTFELRQSTLSPKPPPSSSRSRKKSSMRKSSGSRLSTGRKSRNKSAQSAMGNASPVQTEIDETNEDKESVVKTADETVSEKPLIAENQLLSEFEFDEDDDEDVVDLRAFNTTEKVIYMDFFDLPPQPKVIKNLIIQQVASSKLVRLPYICELKPSKTIEDVISSENAPENTEDSSQDQTVDSLTERPDVQKENSVNPPLVVTLRLPADVSYFEQPLVARWETSKNHWRLDGFTDIKFDEKSNILRFKANHFSPFAIFQDLYLNMPFQSWEIRPRGLNSCVFTIVAAAIDLEIEIKDSLCCVAHAEDSVQRLRHLRGKWMRPKDLIKKLKASGVNVFPAVDAEKYVSVNMKDLKLERNIYEQIALTSSSFAYSWSRWNSDCGKENIVIQATELQRDEPPMEDDWCVFMVSSKNSCKLKLSEFDETFSEDIAENTKLHADLYHMVTDGVSDESLIKIKETSYLFFDCVLQLLTATKVLTYS